MIWIAFALLLLATVHDLKTREIPDWISLALFVLAVAGALLDSTWSGWLGLAGGAAIGLAIGLALFASGGLGGGDVKLVIALGAVLGPLAILGLLFWMAIAGGILSLIAMARDKETLPYVPAIAAGLLIQGLWPSATAQILGF